MELSSIISDLRIAIAYSKRPGNEGHCLANAKGLYRPVNEILAPAMNALDNVQVLLNDLSEVIEGDNSLQARSIRAAIETFTASMEPNFQSLNAAKASMRGSK